MCVIKSNKKKEKAAGIFLKWFTSPENNLRFVSSTGYLPVTEEAFGDIMLKEIDSITDPNIQKLLQVSRSMQLEYEFYIPPLFDGMDEIQVTYNTQLKLLAAETKDSYKQLLLNMSPEEAFMQTAKGKYHAFAESFQ